MSLTRDEQEIVDAIGLEDTAARDYAGIVEWGIKWIPKWTKAWTDFTITDPGILFLNAKAYLYDQLNFKLDNMFLNNILRYSKSKEQLFYMAQLMGLELPGYNSAIGYIRVVNNSAKRISIPVLTPFYVKDEASGDIFYFRSLQPIFVNPGQYGIVIVMEGEFTTYNISPEALKDDFTFVFDSDKCALNSFSVMLDGKYLPKVDDAFLNTIIGPSYSVHYTYDKVVLKFAPGIYYDFTDDSIIQVSFMLSSGAKGNLGIAYLKCQDTLYNDDGTKADLNNIDFILLGSDEGSNPYSLDGTRVFIGENNWRVNSLAIQDDFNYLLQNKFGDYLIRLYSRQEAKKEMVDVYYLPKEEVTAVYSLEAELKKALDFRMIGFTKYRLHQVLKRRVNFRVKFYLKKNTSDLDAITNQAIEITKKYLDIEVQPANFTLQRRELASQFEESIDEVDYASVEYPVSDLVSGPEEALIYGGLEANFDKKEGALNAIYR